MPNSLSLLTPDRLPRDVNLDDPNFDANIFDLYPDPIHFVDLMKSIDREDVSSDLFVRLLEAYREAKSHSNGDSLRYVKIGSASHRTHDRRIEFYCTCRSSCRCRNNYREAQRQIYFKNPGKCYRSSFTSLKPPTVRDP